MPNSIRRSCLQALGLLFLGSACACAAQAEANWPSRPITLVVGYPPGGGSDAMARIVGAKMATRLGQPVVIENRPGGGGQIADAYVARSAPDGYTLVIDASSFAINLGLDYKLSYSAKSFSTVGVLAVFPLVVVAYPGFQAKNMDDVVSISKAKPGSVFFASAGNGTIQQIVGAQLMQLAGIDLTHVPYKGASPAMTDVMGGQVQLFSANAAAAVPLVKSGKLRALAVTGDHRLAALPDTPTLGETSVGPLKAREWIAMHAPAGTPSAILDRVSTALRQALAEPDVKARVEALSGETFEGSRAESAHFVESEIVSMERIIRERGIKPE